MDAKKLQEYEMVIGLEVHVELKTKTKIFCSCPVGFGAEPNTQCCPVCTGLPGTLPTLNGKVVEYAVKAGLALNCEIAGYSKQDRKNYFYPDLPKAYQISQYDLPLCGRGYVDISTDSGSKRIGITRIHIEEDAGKLIHSDTQGTLIDCNRCGVPLIEIVSEPDIRSAEEAVAYLKKLRAIILYTGVSDVKMQEGSLRCDVNLSVRKKGDSALGTRTEMKNLNSFQFISKAIEYEFKRQVEAVESGEQIIQETRRFDQTAGKTYSMRRKENANDYRYFPDPDLPPVEITAKVLELLRKAIPQLPDDRKRIYTERYGLTDYDAELLTTDRDKADLFEAAAAFTAYPRTLANLMISGLSESEAMPGKRQLGELCDLIGNGTVNSNTAKKVLKIMCTDGRAPSEIVEAEGLAQINDRELLGSYVAEALEANPKSIADFKRGRTAALKAVVGAVMNKTGGRANPVIVSSLVDELIQKY